MESGRWSDKNRFLAVLKINFLMFVGEFAVGLYSGSWMMLSDSFHLFLDTLAPLSAYLSELRILGLSQDKIKKASARFSISLFFIAAGVVAWEAITRIKKPPEIKINTWFFVVAIIGLIGNFYSFLVLKKEGGENWSVIRKLLSRHMLIDTGGSIIIIVGAIGILIWQNYILDPILSLVLAVFIVLAPFVD